MNKASRKSRVVTVCMISVLLVLAVTSLAACTQSSTTTVDRLKTVTQTVRVVVTVSAGTASSIPQEVPQSPHPLNLVFGSCFNCHHVPAGHEGRMVAVEICGDCHVELPGLTEN
jgi:hypothetical protein